MKLHHRKSLKVIEMKRVAVVGSRGINRERGIFEVLNALDHEIGFSKLISGGAIGVDTIARKWRNAYRPNLFYKEIIPNYKRFGRYAPLQRNQTIVDSVDVVIAFWDGKSRGTKFTTDYAERHGKGVIIFKEMQKDGWQRIL